MAFTSFHFLLFISGVILLFHASASLAFRRLLLAAANGVFIASYITQFQQIVPLLSFVLLAYALIEWVRREKSRTALISGLTVTVLLFIFLKRFSFIHALPALPFDYLVIGLSYILFRVLQIMIDASSGELNERIGLLSYFNYTCNFLSFLSGPIERYQDFKEGESKLATEPDSETVYIAFLRVVTGYLKLVVISGAANYIFTNLSTAVLVTFGGVAHMRFMMNYAGAAVSYTVYLYYNFSGYMDIVIGVGLLFGQRLPENFNRPFLARNFLDFWSRWHMTLSSWFKTYLFNPFLKRLMGWFPSPGIAPYLGVAAFFVTFLVMGVWHGTTSIFLLYGLLLGAGASINKLWQVFLTKRLGKKNYRVLSERTTYAYFCRGLTFAYFALALTCLWVDVAQLQTLYSLLRFRGVVSVFLALALAEGALMFGWDYAAAWTGKLRGLAEGFFMRNLALAAGVMLILVVSSFFHKAPEFVYKAF